MPASAPVDLEVIVRNTAEGDKPELRLWLRLLSTTNLVEQEIRRRLRREFGTTLPQFDLMAQLYREKDGLRLGELSRRLMVTNGNVTGLVERLAGEGLIERETAEIDRRVTVARLTARGRELFAIMAKVHEGWLRELFADCDADARKELLTTLGQLKRSVTPRITGGEA